MKRKNQKELYTVLEAAEFLGKTKSSIYSAVKNGWIKSVKARRGFRIVMMIPVDELVHAKEQEGKIIEGSSSK